MKTRIALAIIGIISCAAAVCISLVTIREKISAQAVETQRQQESLSNAQLDLMRLRQRLDATSIALHQSHEAHDASKRELEIARNNFTTQLTQAHQERDDATTELAAISNTITTEQIAKTGKQIHDLKNRLDVYEEENRALKESVRKLKFVESYVLYCPQFVPLPAELRGKILAYDPKWNFVVLSVGQEQGARPRGELLVSRNGKLIGWLVIDSVHGGRCIANVKQGWQLTEVSEGDTVMPAHPES